MDVLFFPITLNDFFNTRQDIWLNKLTMQQYRNNDTDIAYFIDTFYMYNAHIFKTAFYSINIIMKGFNKKNIKINEKPYKVDFCYLDANLSQFWQLLLSKGPST